VGRLRGTLCVALLALAGVAPATFAAERLTVGTPDSNGEAAESVGHVRLSTLSTTADAVIPGVALEGRRTILAHGAVHVFDGGADGEAETLGDNDLFQTQGLFVPQDYSGGRFAATRGLPPISYCTSTVSCLR
jgi:hypothetical protein